MTRDDPTSKEVRDVLTKDFGFYLERRVGQIDIYLKEQDKTLVGRTYLPHQPNRRIPPKVLEAISLEALGGNDRRAASETLWGCIERNRKQDQKR